MDIRTPTGSAYIPNEVITALRKSRGWGRERLARQFELVGCQHGLKIPDTAAMVKQISRRRASVERYIELYIAEVM